MSASGWVGSLGAVVIAGLAISGQATAQGFDDGNARARAQIETQQSYRGGRGDGWRGDGRRGDGWRDRGRHDRHDHWDRRWRGNAWGWGAGVWAPAPGYFYYNRSSRHDHFGTADAIVLGLFGALVIDALSDNQRRSHNDAYSSALRAPVGQTIIWSDTASNGTATNGNVRVTRDGYAGDKYCREFQQTITVNGQRQDAWGITCREPDGSWRIVPQN